MATLRTLIIGYGSLLRGDDAVGRIAAAELAEAFSGIDSVEIRQFHQLTPEVAELASRYDRVVLIDARVGEAPGQLVREIVRPAAQDTGPLSHYMTPDQLLTLTRLLYGVSPDFILTGITAERFDLGRPLSDPVRAALPALLRLVQEEVREDAPTDLHCA